jgi:glycosyltransferase involved in cell wall biosynthesis
MLLKRILDNVLIITQFFPPETGAGSRRIQALADALSARHAVTVVPLKPGYPSPALFTDVDIDAFDRESHVTIKRAFRFQPYSRSLLLRGFRETWMSLRLVLHASSLPADIVIVTTPSMFLGPFGWLLAKVKRARFLLDVRDLTWRYGRESVVAGYFQAMILYMIEACMQFILRRTDFVVGATSGVSRLLIEEHNVPAGKVATIFNGVSRKFIEAFNENVGNMHKRPCVLYLGLLGNNHGISNLIDVARQLPDIDFVIAGDGPERSLIESQLDPNTLPNVILKPYSVQQGDVIQHYRGADILFAQIKNTPTLNSTSIGSKIFEYMACGKPIVYAGKGLAVDFLAPIGCAEIAEPENPESIAAAIRRLLDNPERARAMGQKGRVFVIENCVREDLMEKFAAEIESRLL